MSLDDIEIEFARRLETELLSWDSLKSTSTPLSPPEARKLSEGLAKSLADLTLKALPSGNAGKVPLDVEVVRYHHSKAGRKDHAKEPARPIPPRLPRQSRDGAPRSTPSTIYNSGAVLAAMPVPRGDPAALGWMGDLPRHDAEQRLRASAELTFLVRYSSNAGSYVLSYKKGPKVLHIAFIHPAEEGRIVVDKEDGSSTQYDSLQSYVNAMRRAGVIGSPFALPDSSAHHYGLR
eukprot:TRINITY_DN8311_c1_g1_i1.p1 TRINITY_DN8311_c1_g1~~TRINITY_DN8311_c1_g1_i1.p1  ORF type:complete len:234 (+),score=19.86 TRINITY_DN8311_c1_g1_i1:136-837(+)